MSEEIKLCPFCGGKADYFGDTGLGYVQCYSCSALICYGNRYSIIKKWNARTESDETKQLRKELEEAKDKLKTYKQALVEISDAFYNPDPSDLSTARNETELKMIDIAEFALDPSTSQDHGA